MICHGPTFGSNELKNTFQKQATIHGGGGGSGCGLVGWAIASDSRGPRLESSHRPKIILDIYCELYWKDENKEKEAGKAHLKKTFSWETVPSSGQSHKHFMLVNYNS